MPRSRFGLGTEVGSIGEGPFDLTSLASYCCLLTFHRPLVYSNLGSDDLAGSRELASLAYPTVSSLVRIDRDELSLESTSCARGSRRGKRGSWANMNIES
jgi:hypothetical protein